MSSASETAAFDCLCDSLISVSPKLFRTQVTRNETRQVLIIDSELEFQFKSAIIVFGVTAEPQWNRRPSSPYITIGPSGNKKRFFCKQTGGWDIPAIIDEIRTRIEQERCDLAAAERLKNLDFKTRDLIERLHYPHISRSHLENCVLFKFAENISVTQAERLVDFLKSEGLA